MADLGTNIPEVLKGISYPGQFRHDIAQAVRPCRVRGSVSWPRMP
jgi:hypothetical protein